MVALFPQGVQHLFTTEGDVKRQSGRTSKPGGAPAVRIGARLRAARQARGLTLDKVAAATGVTKGFLSRLERDDVSPSVASLVAVCDVLGVRVERAVRHAGDLAGPGR
jgi:DNA-binding XRE family transcriptional regulator